MALPRVVRLVLVVAAFLLLVLLAFGIVGVNVVGGTSHQEGPAGPPSSTR